MTNKYFFQGLSSLTTLLVLTACSLNSNPPDSSVIEANSDIEKAQTQPSETKNITQSFQKVPIIEGLEHPWGMTWLPDGTILITERLGRLRVVRNGKLDSNPVAGVPEVLAINQGGLMDIAIHPDFKDNNWIYLTYSYGTPQANRTRVARATYTEKGLENVEVIFEVTPSKPQGQHFGSRILWLPDKTMLVAIGDGGNPPVKLNGELIRKQAQNLDSHLGKIIRINDDGSIPSDNPFFGDSEVASSIWSYGHRNIQGLILDTKNNRIWSTEHGARGGDELNLIQKGQNYGWPIVTYSNEYFGPPISDETSRPGMIDPKIVWTPSIAPSGLAFYDGTKFPVWQGDLLAGALVDQEVVYIDLDETGKVISQESIKIGQRVRDVRVGPDGFVYILTDEDNGQLIRLEPNS